MTNLEAVRRAMMKVLGISRATAERHTYTGATDPGEWSPRAAVVVHTEFIGAGDEFIPNPGACDCSTADFERWFTIDREVQANGCDLFHEPVNGAVIAFHKC
jgi:hypothetical protein